MGRRTAVYAQTAKTAGTKNSGGRAKAGGGGGGGGGDKEADGLERERMRAAVREVW